MKHWLISTIYRDVEDDELYTNTKIYSANNVHTAINAVPRHETIREIEEIFEDDVELFDCEIVK